MKKILIFLLILTLLASCGKMQETTSQQKTNSGMVNQQTETKKVIYTSFYPLYFITKGLTGDKYEIRNLVPSGGEPHEFEPTPKQVQEILSASYVVMNGLGMEHYEEKLVHQLEEKKIAYTLLSEKLKNIISTEEEHKEEHHEEEGHHDHGPIDPHTWLSPKVMSQLATILATDLKVQDTQQAKEFIAQLENLDKRYSEILPTCKRKELITSHEAFAYLARDYGLIQVPVAGIEPDMEPSAKDIAHVIDIVKEKKVTTVFTEPLVSPKFTETISRESGAKTTELDPVESLTPEGESKGEDYISIMEKNLTKIAEGLDCK